MSNAVPVALLDHFATLKDPRQHAKVLYPLPEIMLLVLSATLAGADDFVETVVWGKEHLAFLRRFYRYENDIPSTTRCAMCSRHWNPDLFKACFLAWAGGLRDDDPDIIAIDGKTSRRSHDRRRAAIPLHLVSAWAARQRIVLGQQADRGEIQRNHRHPTVAEASRSERRFSHHGLLWGRKRTSHARSAMEAAIIACR